MADPVTAGIALVGVAASAYGAYTQARGAETIGRAQYQQNQYQARIADMNSQLAKQDAAYALQAGEVEAQESGMRTRAEISQTRATMAAGNIDTSTGSAKNVLLSEVAIGRQNEAIIRSTAAKRAYGFGVQAAEDTAQGTLYRMAGDTALKAGDIGATSSIIGGVGSVSSKWLQAKQSGIFAPPADSSVYS